MTDFRDGSDRTLHVMRDNPLHVVAVLGGMFGARMPAMGAEDTREVGNNIVSYQSLLF